MRFNIEILNVSFVLQVLFLTRIPVLYLAPSSSMTQFMLALRALLFHMFQLFYDFQTKNGLYRERTSLINVNNALKIKGFTRFPGIPFNLSVTQELLYGRLPHE